MAVNRKAGGFVNSAVRRYCRTSDNCRSEIYLYNTVIIKAPVFNEQCIESNVTMIFMPVQCCCTFGGCLFVYLQRDHVIVYSGL